ncbi:hypothetical protein CPB86DRAFT_750890 [Serendipita vermifera]|nr:hypothetical protein CPB86DRAFT_750890 [Serendipita vermifera]
MSSSSTQPTRTTPPSSASASASTGTTSPSPTPTDSELSQIQHELNPVISFIIGFAIILGASLMNAGGLNLVKLDMVRTMALPKNQRKRDFQRPLWLLGMILYILSQLIGSTLALEFIRAEYVAPLGSSSLIFNFLFASWLVGTPVTRNDIYGTIIVVVGVIGIVAFGSINKGLVTHMDAALLQSLWSRPGWLAFFILFGFLPILVVYIGASQLETILLGRMDIIGVDMVTPKANTFSGSSSTGRGWRNLYGKQNNESGGGLAGLWNGIKQKWESLMSWTRNWMERWSLDKNDKTLAWTLGICWACCGGALAGCTLVFAKASVKLVSGKLSHRNTQSQFINAAAIVTFIFTALTAVLQILCLNRGLRAYDSTLVVPVFYGVYTASGFLDSLIFNDEVDAYETWTLFLIFASILVLISGVVLLTLKKPEPKKAAGSSGLGGTASRSSRRVNGTHPKTGDGSDGEEDGLALTEQGGSKGLSWSVGEDESDEDDDDLRKDPMQAEGSSQRRTLPNDGPIEIRGLMSRDEADDHDNDFGDFSAAPTVQHR